MGTSSYTKTGGHTKCSVTVHFEQTSAGAKFWFDYSGYAQRYWIPTGGGVVGHWAWYTNKASYIQMDVNGEYTNNYAYTYAHSKGDYAGASGGTEWEGTRSGTSNTLNLAATNNGYVITLHWSGGVNTTDGQTIYYSFNLPIYVNPDGTVKAVTKVYANVEGVIKDCAVYVNVDGVIKQLQ